MRQVGVPAFLPRGGDSRESTKEKPARSKEQHMRKAGSLSMGTPPPAHTGGGEQGAENSRGQKTGTQQSGPACNAQ